MISYKKFNRLIYELFCKPIYLFSTEFRPAWSLDVNDFQIAFNDFNEPINGCCVFWHEEPLNKNIFNTIYSSKIFDKEVIHPAGNTILNLYNTQFAPYLNDAYIVLFANSELSLDKKEILKHTNIHDWYFFFHGFLSLYWFLDYQYLEETPLTIDKVFICLNHLISKKRSYRLFLLSQIKSKNLERFGYISAPLLSKQVILDELVNVDSYLSKTAKKEVYTKLYKHANEMVLDNVADYNNASADIVEPQYLNSSFWHVVTETVFYENKLHLTEKIFKPIATRRPFILVSSPGALKYLKSYGFRTFDKWIDESYDNILDPDERIIKITTELEKLCNLSNKELNNMYLDMQEILHFNHQHFFGNFKEIIVDEMIDNFKKCIFSYNKDRSERFRIPEVNLDYNKIRATLLL